MGEGQRQRSIPCFPFCRLGSMAGHRRATYIVPLQSCSFPAAAAVRSTTDTRKTSSHTNMHDTKYRLFLSSLDMLRPASSCSAWRDTYTTHTLSSRHPSACQSRKGQKPRYSKNDGVGASIHITGRGHRRYFMQAETLGIGMKTTSLESGRQH